MRVGAHVSVAGGVDRAVERQRDVGGNCGQIFTHSPQVWEEPDLADEEVTTFREETAELLADPWVIHSAYLVNLATPKEDLRGKSIRNIQAELDAADRLGIQYVNVHLGAHTGAGVSGGLENAASAIDELAVPPGVQLLVESDAGSGTKLGGEFEHLDRIRELSNAGIGFCLDTAHAFAAGYDLETPEAVDETVAAFEEIAGLEHLELIHLNDSKHPCGSNTDEHAHIGEGEIGEAGMRAIVNHDAWRDLPFVLETPTGDDKGFEWNVARTKELRED